MATQNQSSPSTGKPSPGRPLWRRGVEAVDKSAAPILEGVVGHDAFALGYALLERGRRAVYRRTERISRRVLHGLNIPTASDVNRLLTQIAAVEHRVRSLSNAVEDRLPAGREVPGAVGRARRPARQDRT